MQIQRVGEILPIPYELPQKPKTPLDQRRNRGGENPNNFAEVLQEEIRQQIRLVI